MSADRYVEWDAAYVLGALAPDERAEFEQHLAGCDRCRAAVGELAGMPGLLTQVPPVEALAMDADPGAEIEPPLTSAGGTPAAPQPGTRPRWWQLVAAAVLVAVLGGLGGYGLRGLSEQDQTRRLAFSAVMPPRSPPSSTWCRWAAGPTSGSSASTPRRRRGSRTPSGSSTPLAAARR